MDIPPYGPIMIGVDVARFGDDKSCVIVRQGRVVLQCVTWGKSDVVDTAGRVMDIVRAMQSAPAQVAVDTIGIGAGVADILRRDLGEHVVVDVNSSLRVDDGNNYNLRARMWAAMREWLKNGASIPNDHDLQSDLTALQYGYRGGLLLLESKDDAKKRGVKSPDRADALALTFAIPPKKADQDVQTAHAAWRVLDEVMGY
jgi:hypothetical protein